MLTKGISIAFKNKSKEQKGGFLSMLLGTLAASVLRNALPGKRVITAREGVIKSGEKI